MTDKEEVHSQVERAMAEVLPVDFAVIPDALKAIPNWVGWKYEFIEDKLKKPLYNLRTGNRASPTNPATWSDFSFAEPAYHDRSFAGIGIVLEKARGIVVIDIDHCVDAEGVLSKKAQVVVDYLGSYAEYSPSKTGIHIYMSGFIPGLSRKSGSFEMYEDMRYMTVTGAHIAYSPSLVLSHQEKLEYLYNRIFRQSRSPISSHRHPALRKSELDRISTPRSIHEQADRIISYGMKTNANFRRYFDGTGSLWGDGTENPTKSEADWKLCLMLAYRTYPKKEEHIERVALIDAVFRRSRLNDEKWCSAREHTTYGMLTIEKAIDVNDDEVAKKKRS
ncbi:MAG TPA: hypothetical protein VNG51_24355 [Ktedonobacteraceae bacterium]|nr:hypothetical protein [Ktedonobacteraceae bacterium]